MIATILLPGIFPKECWLQLRNIAITMPESCSFPPGDPGPAPVKVIGYAKRPGNSCTPSLFDELFPDHSISIAIDLMVQIFIAVVISFLSKQ